MQLDTNARISFQLLDRPGVYHARVLAPLPVGDRTLYALEIFGQVQVGETTEEVPVKIFFAAEDEILPVGDLRANSKPLPDNSTVTIGSTITDVHMDGPDAVVTITFKNVQQGFADLISGLQRQYDPTETVGQIMGQQLTFVLDYPSDPHTVLVKVVPLSFFQNMIQKMTLVTAEIEGYEDTQCPVGMLLDDGGNFNGFTLHPQLGTLRKAALALVQPLFADFAPVVDQEDRLDTVSPSSADPARH